MKIILQNSLVSKGLSCNGWLGGVGSRKSSIDCPDPESKTNLKKMYKVTRIFRKRYIFCQLTFPKPEVRLRVETRVVKMTISTRMAVR